MKQSNQRFPTIIINVIKSYATDLSMKQSSNCILNVSLSSTDPNEHSERVVTIPSSGKKSNDGMILKYIYNTTVQKNATI